MKLSNFKISARLGADFAVVLTITTLIVLFSLSRLEALNTSLVYQPSVLHQREAAIDHWKSGAQLNLARGMAVLYKNDAQYLGAVQAETEATRRALADDIKTVTGPKLRQELEGIARVGKQYDETRELLFSQRLSGGPVALDAQQALVAQASAYIRAIEGAAETIDKLSKAKGQQTIAMVRSSQWLIGIGGLIAVLCGVGAAILVSLSIVRPVRRAVAVAESVADGDLAASIASEGKDETAQLPQSLAAMQRKLATIVSEVRQNAEGVASASREIAAGNDELSSRTKKQASSLEETAASMEQVTQQNAALVEESTAATTELKHEAEKLVRCVAVFRLGGHLPVAAQPQAAPPREPAPARTAVAPTRKPVAPPPLRVVSGTPARQLATAGGDLGDWESF